MQEEQELWHACTHEECWSIFDSAVSICPFCETGNPQELHLTLMEVLERVEPKKVLTKQPGRFTELLKEREQALAIEEHTPEAVQV